MATILVIQISLSSFIRGFINTGTNGYPPVFILICNQWIQRRNTGFSGVERGEVWKKNGIIYTVKLKKKTNLL